MSEIKHTPLPWQVWQTLINCNEYGGHWIEPADKDQDICISGSGGARSYTRRVIDTQIHDDNKANAEFIVRACNSHYDLLECLKNSIDAMEKFGIADGGIPAAKEAIDKAEGRT